MKPKTFTVEIQSGHKGDGVVVPFDPVAVWGQLPRKLWRGRHGHVVGGKLNNIKFDESFIVPRARKFFLLLGKDLTQAAGVSAGDLVTVTIKARAGQ